MSITYDTTTGLRALLGGNLVSDIDTGFLSLAQDIAAALGHSMQEGVIDAGSFETTQASGGASMVLDVASNVGTGAFVQNDSATGLPLVYLPPTGSKTSVTVGTAHATLPRVDAIVVSTAGVVSVVAGTATSGATLNNARDGSHGGAVIPSNALHLADVLVAATVTTLANSVIRDRRRWARGAHYSTHIFGGTYNTPSSLGLVDGTNLQPRIECSGAPLRVTFEATLQLNPSAILFTDLFVDGAQISPKQQRNFSNGASGAFQLPICAVWEITPAAGSHLIGPAYNGSGTTGSLVTSASTFGITLIIEEVLRQSTANNPTTSG